MPKRRMTDDQCANALQECRKSGLTDKDWCAEHEIHPSSFYRAIRRLRKKACPIPSHDKKTVPLKQEVALVASIDENGIITQPCQNEPLHLPANELSTTSYTGSYSDTTFETTVRIVAPSGIQIELSNSTNAATIRCILGALQPI